MIDVERHSHQDESRADILELAEYTLVPDIFEQVMIREVRNEFLAPEVVATVRETRKETELLLHTSSPLGFLLFLVMIILGLEETELARLEVLVEADLLTNRAVLLEELIDVFLVQIHALVAILADVLQELLIFRIE